MPSIPVGNGQIRLTSHNVGYTVTGKIRPYPVAQYPFDPRQWGIQVTGVINGLLAGKSNNTGIVTLAASSATTTVTLSDGRMGPTTLVILIPLTASAATEFGAGSLYLSGRDPANNTFTLTHVNSATADRKFGFVLVG